MDISDLSDAFAKLQPIDTSSWLSNMDFNLPRFEVPDFESVEIGDSLISQINEQIEEQNKLVSQQINILVEQNKLLTDNYDKLKSLYDQQYEMNKQAQEDLQASRNYNRWMMRISVVAMLAAIAGPIVTILVSQ